jgi:shikimate kinase
MQKNIVLIGFMGTGKTSVGGLIANRMGWPFIDTDLVIVNKVRKSIPDIFRTKGEEYFRAIEHEVISDVTKRNSTVIATGGGAVLNPENMRMLRECGIVVALDAQLDTIWNRIKESNDRPLVFGKNSKSELEDLFLKRLHAYENAHLRIKVDNKKPQEIAEEIINIIKNDNGNYST